MKTKLYDQHSDHTEWLNKLAFYNDEIRIMQGHLEEISRKNTAKEVLMEVEHFQNQIMIQAKNILTISSHIAMEEKQVQQNILNNPVAADHRQANDHAAERELVLSFENNFNALRKEFNVFLSKWF